jgi:hypothetical protein
MWLGWREQTGRRRVKLEERKGQYPPAPKALPPPPAAHIAKEEIMLTLSDAISRRGSGRVFCRGSDETA